jgi:hypothetical protein
MREAPRLLLAPTAFAPRRSSGMLRQWLAVAAALLAAFLTGFAAGRPVSSGAVALKPSTSKPTTLPPIEIVDAEVHEVGQLVLPAIGPVLVAGVPGMQITVYEGKGLDEEWLRRQPYSVPELVAKQLERKGCRLYPERQCLPVALSGGRRLAVVVDRNQLQIVGRRPVL